MAFVQSPLPEEEQNQFSPQGTTSANPLGTLPPQATSTGGSSGQGAGGTGSAPGVGTPTQFGSTASRLSDYLSANGPQTQQMAGNIAGNFNTQYGQTQGAIQNLGGQFQQQVQQGYTPFDQATVDSAAGSPSEFAKTPGNVQKFQQQANDVYSGPQNIESTQPYADVQRNVQDAVQGANLVQTYPGLSTYLQNNTSGQYTPGMNTLDTTLLQANQPAYKTITSATNQFQNLPGQLGEVAKAGNASVQSAAAEAPKAAQYAQNALTTSAANMGQSLQDQLKQAQGAYQTYNTDVGKLRGSAQDINTSIQDYLRQNPNIKVSGNTDFLSPWVNLQEAQNAPQLANVATADDYANFAALQQLGGSGASINSPLDQNQAKQAGSFNLPQDLQAAIANGAVPEAMRNELGTMQQQIQGAYQPYQDVSQVGQKSADLITQAQANNRQWTPDMVSQLSDLLTQTGQDPTNVANQIKLAQTPNSGTTFDQLADSIGNWSKQQMNGAAQGLQWLPQAAGQYNDLVTRLQADMTGLGGMNMPSYTMRAPSAAPKQVGNAIGTGIGVGAPIGAATGATAASVPITASQLAASGLSVAGEVPAAGLSPLATIGPAAIAAYGASNIAQNSIANPVESGLATLANTGLSLATLSLPPKVLNSIEGGLKNVINSIGDFFGGLF